MSNAPPSIDPANEGSVTGLFRHVMTKLLQSFNGMLPGEIISYDRVTNLAVVKLLVMVVDTKQNYVSRAPIAQVPVRQFGGGGFILSFNLQPGNKGWVRACDRDISLFLRNYGESAPQTFRMHNFSDSMFEPDPMTGFTINAEDAENAVLQSLDSSVRIALWPNKVKITAPNIELDANVLVTGTLTVEQGLSGAGGLQMSGGGTNSIVVTGNLRTVGNIEATGDITPHVP